MSMRQHFHARDERVAQMRRRPRDLVQHAVDSQAHTPAVLNRLYMQIGRVQTRGFLQRVGEQADGGRTFGIRRSR
jgi:hypothetical protein